MYCGQLFGSSVPGSGRERDTRSTEQAGNNQARQSASSSQEMATMARIVEMLASLNTAILSD